MAKEKTKKGDRQEGTGEAWSRKHYNVDDIHQYDLTPAKFVVEFVGFLKKNGLMEVLDAGCGQGRHMKYLLEQGFEAIGVDASSKALELCRRLLKESDLRVPLLFNTELQNLSTELRAESNDAIICVTVMTHMPEPEKVLEQFLHVLKPGGYAIMDFANIEDSTYPLISKGKRLGENAFDDGGTYVKYYKSEEEVRRLFEGSGLEITKLEEVKFLDRAHPGSRPFPHWHSSFVVIAQKPGSQTPA